MNCWHCERPAHGACRHPRFPQARQPLVARLSPENLFERGLELGAAGEARRVGSVAGVLRPFRAAEHPGESCELPVRAPCHDEIAVGRGKSPVMVRESYFGAAAGRQPSGPGRKWKRPSGETSTPSSCLEIPQYWSAPHRKSAGGSATSRR